MKTSVILAGLFMVLAAPVQEASAASAAAVRAPAQSTTISNPQTQMVAPQTQLLPPPPVASPAITTVNPADCVAKGGTMDIEGSNLLPSFGRSIALDDGAGTHVNLPVSSWTGTSISATVPDDPHLKEGAAYRVAMEKSDHSQWLSNTDKSITICAAASSAPESPTNPQQPASGGGSLLGGAMPPPPPAQNLQGAPIKEDVTVESGEVLALSADMNEALQLQNAAQSLGLGIKRRMPLGNLGRVMSVLRVPKGTTVSDALNGLRKAMPNAWVDANHRYQLQAGDPARYASQAIAWHPASGCGAGMNIGLIDTAINETHPLLKGRAIVQRSFLAAGIVAAPADHGTATASILVADPPIGLMPDVQLHAAAVFRLRNNKDVETTAEWIVSALDWLAGEKAEVINLSFAGSRNLVLEAAAQRVLDLGIVIVAAAGNGGANGAPMYPAAQPGVIAVTAIDANLKPYDRASRGNYISYAAPGVDVWVASPGGDGTYATGTSYAAPFVTAVIAAAKWSEPGLDRAALDRLLQSKAKDLGAPGRDNIFGWGLIQMPVECVHSVKAAQGRSKRPKPSK